MSNYSAFSKSIKKNLYSFFTGYTVNGDKYGVNRRKREDIREKKVKSGEFKESRKIISNLSVFLALILRWLV